MMAYAFAIGDRIIEQDQSLKTFPAVGRWQGTIVDEADNQKMWRGYERIEQVGRHRTEYTKISSPALLQMSLYVHNGSAASLIALTKCWRAISRTSGREEHPRSR